MNTYETQFRLDTFFSSALLLVAVAWLALGSVQDAAHILPGAGEAAALSATAHSAPRGAAERVS